MNSISRFGLMLLFCTALGLFVQASSARADETENAEVTPGAEQELDATQAELTELLHYFLENSATEEAHAKFWADELVYTSSNGTRFGKADIMQGFADAEESDTESSASDAPEVVFTGEEVNVQVFDTTAVVTFRLVGTPNDGSEPMQYFNSGTFLKRQGQWRAVNWQATIIPQDEP